MGFTKRATCHALSFHALKVPGVTNPALLKCYAFQSTKIAEEIRKKGNTLQNGKEVTLQRNMLPGLHFFKRWVWPSAKCFTCTLYLTSFPLRTPYPIFGIGKRIRQESCHQCHKLRTRVPGRKKSIRRTRIRTAFGESDAVRIRVLGMDIFRSKNVVRGM